MAGYMLCRNKVKELTYNRLETVLSHCVDTTRVTWLQLVGKLALRTDSMNNIYKVRQHFQTQYINQSINQSINQYVYYVPWYRGACYSADHYAEAKRNVLSRVLNVLADGAVRQFRGSEFQSLGAATEKRRAAVSKLCGGTDRKFCVNDRSERDWLYGLIRSAR